MKVAKYQKVLFLSHFQLNNCLDFSILNNVAYIELLHTCSNLKKISFLSKSSQKQTFKEFQNSNCLNRDNFVIVSCNDRRRSPSFVRLGVIHSHNSLHFPFGGHWNCEEFTE